MNLQNNIQNVKEENFVQKGYYTTLFTLFLLIHTLSEFLMIVIGLG
jgi:hypothetical protein